MDGKKKILIAEDHKLVLQGLKAMLSSVKDYEVVGEAEDGLQAVKACDKAEPDLILMDLSMPLMNGVEAIREIKSRHPDTKILAVTVHKTEDQVLQAFDAGADGYVLKTASADELVRAVRAVHAGQSALSPQVTRQVIQHLKRGAPARATDQVESLTERELDVLHLAARGMTNRTIGSELGISHRTVQGHLASIYDKLDVNSRTEAVTAALKRGWIVVE